MRLSVSTCLSASSSPAAGVSSLVPRTRVLLGGAALAGAIFVLWRRFSHRRQQQHANDSTRIELTDSIRELFYGWNQYLGRSSEMNDAIITQRFWSVYHTALASHSYRCIHEKRFLEARMTLHPYYQTLIHSSPVADRRLLDIGCCFGTDLRRLILDGFQSENLLGLDINDTFIRLGLELLFEDGRQEDPLTQRFVTGDILDPEVEEKLTKLKEFKEKGIDVIYAGSVYHLLNQDDTVRLSESMYRLLSPGGSCFGRTVGIPGDRPDGIIMDRSTSNGKDLRYLHSAESLRRQLSTIGFVNIRIDGRVIDMPGMRQKDTWRGGWKRAENEQQQETTMLTFYAEKPTQASN